LLTIRIIIICLAKYPQIATGEFQILSLPLKFKSG